MIVLALGPLMTFFFAFGHGLERFRWPGLMGAVIALLGIVIGVGGASTRAPLVPVLAIAAGAAAIGEAAVLLKRSPGTDPVVTNAIALGTGAALLAVISLVARERWILPLSSRGEPREADLTGWASGDVNSARRLALECKRPRPLPPGRIG